MGPQTIQTEKRRISLLDINFHGFANLNQTEYIQKAANKYFLRLFRASFTYHEMFREEFSTDISNRRDIYASIKARYPPGLNLNKVKYPMAYTYLYVSRF